MESSDYLGWKYFENNLKDQIEDELCTLTPEKTIFKSTKLFNKSITRVKTYSEFLKCKKKVLKQLTKNAIVADESELSEDDYSKFYEGIDNSDKTDTQIDYENAYFSWLYVEKKGTNTDEPQDLNEKRKSGVLISFEKIEKKSKPKQHKTIKTKNKKLKLNNVKKLDASTSYLDKKKSSKKTKKTPNKQKRDVAKRDLTDAIDNVDLKVNLSFQEDDWNNEFLTSDFQAHSTQIFTDTFSDNVLKSKKSDKLKSQKSDLANQPKDSGIEEDSRETNGKYENDLMKKISSPEIEDDDNLNCEKGNTTPCSKTPIKKTSEVDKNLEKESATNKIISTPNKKCPLKIIGDEKVTKKFKIINNKEEKLQGTLKENHVQEEKNIDKFRKLNAKKESDSEYEDCQVSENIKVVNEEVSNDCNLLDIGTNYNSDSEENSFQSCGKSNSIITDENSKNQDKEEKHESLFQFACKSSYMAKKYKELKSLRLVNDTEDESDSTNQKYHKRTNHRKEKILKQSPSVTIDTKEGSIPSNNTSIASNNKDFLVPSDSGSDVDNFANQNQKKRISLSNQNSEKSFEIKTQKPLSLSTDSNEKLFDLEPPELLELNKAENDGEENLLNDEKNLDNKEKQDSSYSSSSDDESKKVLINDKKTVISNDDDNEDSMQQEATKRLQGLKRIDFKNIYDSSDDEGDQNKQINSYNNIEVVEHEVELPNDLKKSEIVNTIINSSTKEVEARHSKEVLNNFEIHQEDSAPLTQFTKLRRGLDLYFDSEEEPDEKVNPLKFSPPSISQVEKTEVKDNFNKSKSYKESDSDSKEDLEKQVNESKLSTCSKTQVEKTKAKSTYRNDESDSDSDEEMDKKVSSLELFPHFNTQGQKKNKSGNESNSESDTEMSVLTQKKLGQFKKMNLFNDSGSSSSDDDHEFQKKTISNNSSNNNKTLTQPTDNLELETSDSDSNTPSIPCEKIKGSSPLKKKKEKVNEFSDVTLENSKNEVSKSSTLGSAKILEKSWKEDDTDTEMTEKLDETVNEKEKTTIIMETQESNDSTNVQSQEMFSSLENLDQDKSDSAKNSNEEPVLEKNSGQTKLKEKDAEIVKLTTIPQLVERCNLQKSTFDSTLRINDISSDEIFLLDIPKSFFNENSIGQGISYSNKNKTLSLGQYQYEAMEKKNTSTLSCIFQTENGNSYEIINVRPKFSITARRRLEKPEDIRNVDEPTENLTINKNKNDVTKEILQQNKSPIKAKAEKKGQKKEPKKKFVIENFLSPSSKKSKNSVQEKKMLKRKLSSSFDGDINENFNTSTEEATPSKKILKRKLPISSDDVNTNLNSSNEEVKKLKKASKEKLNVEKIEKKKVKASKSPSKMVSVQNLEPKPESVEKTAVIKGEKKGSKNKKMNNEPTNDTSKETKKEKKSRIKTGEKRIGKTKKVGEVKRVSAEVAANEIKQIVGKLINLDNRKDKKTDPSDSSDEDMESKYKKLQAQRSPGKKRQRYDSSSSTGSEKEFLRRSFQVREKSEEKEKVKVSPDLSATSFLKKTKLHQLKAKKVYFTE